MWVRLVARNYFEWWDWVEKRYISKNGLLLISGYFHTSYSINLCMILWKLRKRSASETCSYEETNVSVPFLFSYSVQFKDAIDVQSKQYFKSKVFYAMQINLMHIYCI